MRLRFSPAQAHGLRMVSSIKPPRSMGIHPLSGCKMVVHPIFRWGAVGGSESYLTVNQVLFRGPMWKCTFDPSWKSIFMGQGLCARPGEGVSIGKRNLHGRVSF